ncbi:uncharacterized protein LOC142330111 isoform X2 [Lycorma delicatula]|uniref:uncharacterized protein LOC142330111 isoform X2 n=1 Tax=Lycorma delicatula TaxID=130591 RepID=UPI003F5143E0
MTEVGILMDGHNWHSTARPSCEIIFSGNKSRSGHFDSRNLDWNQNCTYIFIGKFNDVVHLSLFNYKLKSPSYQSMIELFDGPILERNKPMKKICSPSIKHARDSSGKFQLYQTFLSSGNILSLLFRRFAALSSQPEQEFIDGAYVFHDGACSAWNISFHKYSEQNTDRTGTELYTFCSRDGYKNYSLPWKLNIVVIKLTAMTRRPPQFQIKWRSQIVRANTRTAGPVPEMASQATVCTHLHFLIVFLLLINNLTHR